MCWSDGESESQSASEGSGSDSSFKPTDAEEESEDLDYVSDEIEEEEDEREEGEISEEEEEEEEAAKCGIKRRGHSFVFDTDLFAPSYKDYLEAENAIIEKIIEHAEAPDHKLMDKRAKTQARDFWLHVQELIGDYVFDTSYCLIKAAKKLKRAEK